ncbi:MAG: hypothetical protein IJT94_01965 [Oscillibacter sp.]|nr:hypothetical protein [Oscillibacter sp.]
MLRSGKRVPVRDNSRNIAVHMTEDQYQRLRRYMELTRLGITVYFRKLIQGERLLGHDPELSRSMYSGVNRIYSNVQQIARNERARAMDDEAVRQLVFLTDRLCEEVYLLSCQE